MCGYVHRSVGAIGGHRGWIPMELVLQVSVSFMRVLVTELQSAARAVCAFTSPTASDFFLKQTLCAYSLY